jgi:hypothetical protein
MRILRAIFLSIGTLLVAIAGALAGALVAVALTIWAVPPDPFATAFFGFGLLLLWVPIGAIVAVWVLSLLADEEVR